MKILGLRSGIQRGFCTFLVFFIILVLTSHAFGSNAYLAVSPTNLDFGSVPVGSSQTRSITLTNPGGPRVTVTQAAVSGNAFVLSGLGYPLTLAGGQSLTCSLTFAPRAAGSNSASLSIALSARADGGPNYSRSWSLSVPVSGIGVTSGQLAPSPTSLNFGNVQVGTSQNQWETLTNVGGVAVTISQIAEAGTGFTVNALSLPATLAPTQSITFSTTFAPQIAGSAVAAITVSSNASNSTLTIPQTGAGIAQGQLIVSPASVSFGNVTVGTSTSQAGTLSATGASVTVSSASVSNSEFALSSGKFPLTIAAGQSLPITVAFAPQYSGAATATLTFTSNASNIATESLAGYGVAPAPNPLTINTTSLPNGTAGLAYSTTLSATGGTPPYQWNISSGSLPAGLSLNARTGAISGTPGTAGQSSFTVQVRDSSSSPQTASANFFITISGSSAPPGAVVVTSFGATGNGATDDTAAINTAIASLQAGQTLWFPCGTYIISGPLGPISLNGVTISGPGTNCATLKLSGSGSFTALRIVGNGLTSAQNLVADTTTNSFTVGSGGLAALGIVPGSYVVVSDKAVASNGTGSPLISTQQVVKVTAVNGDTATIEGSFAHNFTLVSPYPQNQGGSPYVQRIGRPVDGITVTYLAFDGSGNTGSVSAALNLNFVVNSQIGFVSVSNFAQIPGPTNAIRLDTGYRNTIHDILCTVCGNGSTSNGHSLWLQRQSYLSVQNTTITNIASQYTFSLDTESVNNSTMSNVTIDGGGSNGRPFKLLRANHNTLNNITVKNGAGGHNGINVTDISTYNTFNNCVAVNNTGGGIKMFGNFNQHNAFNNCTAQYNTGGQFGQGKDSFGNYGDDFTTVTGGNFGCARNGSAILWIYSNNFTFAGATVNDDQAQASSGLMLAAGNQAAITNNGFSGLPANTDIYIVNATNATFSGNTTPEGTTPNPLP